MRVSRKYNLGRIGHRFESIEIEVEGEDIEEIIRRIDSAWQGYSKAIVAGRVE